MAVDLSARNEWPAHDRITLSATPDEVTQVTFPPGCHEVAVRFVTNTGKVTFDSGSTDGAAIGTDFETVLANTVRVFPVRRGANRQGRATDVFLASGTASCVVEITCN